MQAFDVELRRGHSRTPEQRLAIFTRRIEKLGGTVVSTFVSPTGSIIKARITLHLDDEAIVATWPMVYRIQRPPRPDWPISQRQDQAYNGS